MRSIFVFLTAVVEKYVHLLGSRNWVGVCSLCLCRSSRVHTAEYTWNCDIFVRRQQILHRNFHRRKMSCFWLVRILKLGV
jgi:hypothetical protein